MAKAIERNKKIYILTRGLLTEAGKNTQKIDETFLPTKLRKYVSPLMHQKALGFREVVLTVIIARLAGIKFDPTKNFYDCNPRSLYEQAIRQALEEFEIPCGKSGPLNVAKNENALNKAWARGRRPESAALAAVEFMEVLIPGKSSILQIKNIGLFLAKELLAESERLQKINIADAFELSSNQYAHLYSELIKRFPDGGNTPQKIIGKILLSLIKTYNSDYEILGTDISISATDTTSKKPSDLWVQNKKTGQLLNLYEVTVKKVDLNRIKDSARSLKSLNIETAEVAFLCRIPEDIKELLLTDHKFLTHQSYRYEFFDIFEWIEISLQILGPEGRKEVFEDIRDFIQEFKTKESIKLGFNALVEELSEK